LDAKLRKQLQLELRAVQREVEITFVYVTHDQEEALTMSDRIAVMYLGRIVEVASKEALYREPLHPYTQLLLEAIPTTDRALEKQRLPQILRGEVPSPLDPPSGCTFHPRCPQAMPICSTRAPSPVRLSDGRTIACHLHT
jgi:oligopeptide/dipeptide ABC transporter ATP-binding protein